MANPDYLAIYNQLETETDPQVREQLIASLYSFENFLTAEEAGIFAYVLPEYIQNNPGVDQQGNFVSYVGTYYSDTGEISG